MAEANLDGLVCKLAHGDRSALSELFERARTPVFSLALHLLRDWQAAEDVTIEVFVEFWSSAERIHAERGDPMSWLMTLARHRSIDRRRKRERRRQETFPLTEPTGTALDSLTAGADGSPEAGTLLGERDSRLREALSQLPGDQRRAIELAYFPGLSQVEIARRLGEPLGTIKSRIRLGMQKMRDKLSEDDR